MTFAEAFLEEFDAEMASTRRMLERVPAARFDWRPHAKSKSVRELATHVAELSRFGLRIQKDEFAAGSDLPPPINSTQDLLARFDQNVKRSREAIAGMSEADLDRDFAVMRQGQVFFSLKKRAILRRVLLNHTIHHRGQLSVYLRLNDVLVPGMYGPTADEGM